ncbi:MAG: hypothetical protein HDS62_02035 [Bacteroidales bacterium]|nr:hypothetical protein [Bacteroidales bacterium]
MKPRTQFEKLVKISNEKLADITPKAYDWAVRTQIDHIAFRTSGYKCTCGDCTHRFNYEGKAKSIKCPHCGRMVKILDTNKRILLPAVYFNTTEVLDNIQVLRTFRLNATYRKGSESSYEVIEVCRLWLNSKGQTAVTSRKRTLGYYLDNFNWSSEIELKSLSEVYFAISDCNTYPYFSAIPELRRNGLKKSISYCNPFLLMKYLLTDSRIETLMKGGHTKAVRYFINNHYRLRYCWDSLKVAYRRGYEPTDYSLWCNTISILDRLGRDIRNAKYICPDNLKEAHDQWGRKYQQVERIRIDREQMIKAKKDEDKFIKEKSRFFNIVIKDSDITISVLNSIEEYRAEGDAMHHCVFSASYYNISDSVILSARDKDGRRIETIEFSLTQGKVVQSRGVCNKNTEFHDRIVSLVNDNASLFKKAKESA